MKKEKKALAFDFGASSGRAMCGIFDGERIKIEEIHRFSNDPVMVNKTMYWDVLRLFYEIKQGLLKAKHRGGFESIGIDTWGVDFGLLDSKGNLLENPVHYRDERTKGMLKEAFARLSQQEFYQITGNQFMEINTAFQLLSLQLKRPELLERADKMLLMPDLFNYLLTGIQAEEYSIATTTQLLDAKQAEWSQRVIEALSIPKRLFAPIVPCGTKLGMLSEDICEELGIEKADVIAVAGHDTQSAMVAVPANSDDFIFISCGTWSLFGTELENPLINEKSFQYNITNEGGFLKKASFLKNIIGLWLIQESRRQWIREGKEYSFGELEKMAAETKPFQFFIDPDAQEFVPAGNIPERIRKYCFSTGQNVPETEGEIVRCIDESLAFKYRIALEEITFCTEKEYQDIHIVGGGANSQLLCQATANACHKRVIAGPTEATVFGNIALQLLAKGEIKDLKTARQVIANSSQLGIYEPQQKVQWEEAYQKFCQVTGCEVKK